MNKPARVPPTLNGVSPSCIALPAGAWRSIVDFLCERFPDVAPAEWAARMAAGAVVDECGRHVSASSPFQAGLRVYYYRSLADEAPIPFEESVLFQDDWLVVADKPHFLPVMPSGRYVQETLLVRLKRRLGIDTLSPIHRIDRETAGLVVFAVQPATRGAYQTLFADKAVSKEYEAIAPYRQDLSLPRIHRSRLEEDSCFMQMHEVSGEPNTETRIELIEQSGGLARCRLSPVTGRKHQLRAHCASLGMPILHDRIYPALLAENTDDCARPLQLLARTLSFRDPLSGALRSFASERSLMSLEAASRLQQGSAGGVAG
ncbi:RluA family pseudouridine synthase [Uliginosibacterium flavum]|uniref:RluA family pseudouridine synthase n=1 Tax=Uliginosibacterium flavum TaxID=1396831 RepID=A0ABV2TFL0_9RHOO